jgi:hypothetical protein
VIGELGSRIEMAERDLYNANSPTKGNSLLPILGSSR